MNYQELLKILSAKPEADQCYPFYPDVPVFKIKGKVFAIASLRNGKAQVNLKCSPDQSEVLRMLFDSVVPGYHMNKKHWNTVFIDSELPASKVPDYEIERMIDHSYGLVVKGLKASQRKSLELGYGHKAIYGDQ